MPELSSIIIKHRKTADLTQAGLARLAGVGKTVIWDLEHGKESVQWDTLQKVLHVLNLTPIWQSPLLERERAITQPAMETSTTAASAATATGP
jgi:transcriptional regulator with XRE-family HTH domain